MAADQINQRDWQDMEARMAQLKIRLANQEYRQQHQPVDYHHPAPPQLQSRAQSADRRSPPRRASHDKLHRASSDGRPSQRRVSSDEQRTHRVGSDERRRPRQRVAAEGVVKGSKPEPHGGAVRLPPLAKNEYEFLWERGALGLSLVADESLQLPVVKRVTGTGSSSSINRVEEGDVLVYINERSTREYDMATTMDLLKHMPKPVLLRFATRKRTEDVHIPKLQAGEYDILWENGPLGLVMEACPTSALPVVKRMTTKGMTKGLSRVRVGDTLTMVNDRECIRVGFHGIMAYLKDIPKPCVLRFKQTASTTAAERDSSGSTQRSSTSTTATLNDGDCYLVQWNDGPFGLTLKEYESAQGLVPVVARVTGRSTCAGLRRVAVGDFLVEVGPFQALELGFDTTTKILKNIEKPVTLKFQARIH